VADYLGKDTASRRQDRRRFSGGYMKKKDNGANCGDRKEKKEGIRLPKRKGKQWNVARKKTPFVVRN